MSDDQDGRDVVDLSPCLAGGGDAAELGWVSQWVADKECRPVEDKLSLFAFRWVNGVAAPQSLDGPGYVVLGEFEPGAAVRVGRMPDGVAGGVAEWMDGRIDGVDGMAAPAEGVPGWYVPAGATHCPRCGDQNWETDRRCITCTDGDDGYADGAFADGWSADGYARAHGYADAAELRYCESAGREVDDEVDAAERAAGMSGGHAEASRALLAGLEQGETGGRD